MARQQERSVVIPCPADAPDGGSAAGGRVLEAVFVPGVGEAPGGAVIAPPHPLYGGSLGNPLVGEIGWACQRTGLATLRFNWRGVGASAGEPSGAAEDADADYAAALADLAQSVAGPLVAAGYSFGAAAAVRVAEREPRVRRLVLVAPPPSLLDAGALAAFRGQALLVAGEADAIAPPQDLRARLGDDARRTLEVIPQADHFFGNGLSALGRSVLAWLGGERVAEE